MTFNNTFLNYTLSGGSIAAATSLTKKGAGGVTFDNVNTYGGLAAITAGTLTVGSGGSLTASGGVTVAALGNLNVNSGGALGSNTVLTANGMVSLSDAAQSIVALSGTNSAAALSLNPTPLTITAANGTYPGTLGGSGSLYLQGGNLVLANTGNTYSGGTSIGPGAVLNVAGDGALGATTASPNITFSGGLATLQLGSQFNLAAARNIAISSGTGAINTNTYATTIAGAITGNGALDVQGGGMVTLANSTNSYLGGTGIEAGTLLAISASGNINSGALSLNGGTLDIGSGAAPVPFLVANSVSLNNAASAMQVDVASAAFSGAFLGSGGLAKSGSGSLLLGNSNGFSGNVTINSGGLVLGNSAALGAAANSVTFNASGATLDVAGFSPILNGGLISGGTAQPSGYGLVTNSGSNSATLSMQDNNSEFSGSIQDNGTNKIALVIQPVAGKTFFILSGSNTYSGGTTVSSSAELELWNASALGTAGALVQNGATLALKGRSDPIVYATAPLAFQGNSSFGVNTDQTLRNATWNGNVTLDVSGTNTTLTVTGMGNTPQTSTLTINGNVTASGSNGIASLTKSGSALELILSGVSSYTGTTTVTGGALRLANTAALPGGIAGDGNGKSNLVLNGGILGLGAADFKRGLGTGPDNVQFGAAGGGFAAYRAARGQSRRRRRNADLGAAPFLPNGSSLMLGYGSDNNTVDFQNPINLGSQVQNVQLTHGSAAVDGQLSGLLSDNGGGGLSVTGNGVLAITNSASSFSGNTTITGVTVSVPYLPNGAGTSPLGTWNNGASSVTLAGGTLRYTGPTLSTDRQFTIGAGGAALDASGSGPVSFTSTAPLTFSTTSATLTLTGFNAAANTLAAAINDNGASPTSITKTGPGAWTLTGPGNYSGPTTVSGGTLVLANPALANNSTAVVNGGVLSPGGGAVVSVPALTGSGGSVLVPFGQTLQAGSNNASTLYSGQLAGPGVFNKVGSGAMTVSSSAYSGTVNVNAGVLVVQGGQAAAFAGQGLNVAPGATFLIANQTGLFGSYYNSTGQNTDISSGNLATFQSTLGTLTQFTSAATTVGQNKTANVFNYDDRTVNTWPAAVVTKSTSFDACWTGYLNVPASGVYTIGFTGNDDAAAMWLDGNTTEVVNSTAATGNTSTASYTFTTPGPHLITIGLVQGPGDYYIYPTITIPGGAAQPIPNWMLSYGTTTVTVGPLSGAGNVSLGVNSLVVNNNGGSTNFSGVISGSGGLTAAGPGSLTLNGTAPSTYTGATTVNSGGLVLDFSGWTPTGGTIGNLVNSAFPLVLVNGGQLTVNGNANASTTNVDQTFSGTTLGGLGTSSITGAALGGEVVTLHLGTITRNAPATMDVAAVANFSGSFQVQTNSPNINGILGGYITSGGTTWAARGAGGYIGPLANANYAVDDYSNPANNVDIQAGGTVSFAAVNSLRFNTPTAAPLDLSGVFQNFVVNTGGILVTSNVGPNAMSIVNGSITASGGTAANSGSDLVVIQNNTAAAMTIASQITNNGATAIGLTKAGPGLLIITNNANNFTGPTAVTGGTLQASAETLPATNLSVASGANVTFNESSVQPWANSLTGGGSFTLTGNGALTISNSNFAYTGATTVSGGTLALPSNVALATSSVTVGPGATFNLPGVHNLGSAPLSVSGVLDLTGNVAGQLSVGSVSLNAATLNLTLSGGTALSGSAISVNGTNTVNVSGAGIPGNTYTLVSGSSLDTSAAPSPWVACNLASTR